LFFVLTTNNTFIFFILHKTS